MPATIEHIEKVLAYLNENGEPATLEHYQIRQDTLDRYKRRKRYWETKEPKILLLDIETARIIFGGWRIGKQRVTHEQIIKDWFMLGWSAKWLFSSAVMSEFVTADEALKRDDARICNGIWKLMNDADIIIAHNGKKSDIPRLNTRLILNGFTPPMPYQIIDTYQVASKQFSFASASLNYLSLIMHRKQKLHTDYQLWIDCENGKQESIDYMHKYCIEDTNILEEVYVEIRPWIKSHPNLAVIMEAEEPCCPNCGGFEFEEGEGYYTTAQNKYISVRCAGCGAVNRKKVSEISAKTKNSLLVPMAR